MTNPKALAVTERTALANTLFENPELTAMAAICEILQELPDEAARLRVMHWSFGRFAAEFKRAAPATAGPGVGTMVSRPVSTPAVPVALAPVTPVPGEAAPADMETQISELQDLFTADAHRPSVRAYAGIS